MHHRQQQDTTIPVHHRLYHHRIEANIYFVASPLVIIDFHTMMESAIDDYHRRQFEQMNLLICRLTPQRRHLYSRHHPIQQRFRHLLLLQVQHPLLPIIILRPHHLRLVRRTPQVSC